jgi:hypothetical protein
MTWLLTILSRRVALLLIFLAWILIYVIGSLFLLQKECTKKIYESVLVLLLLPNT